MAGCACAACVFWLVGVNGRGRVWEGGNGVGGMSVVYWRRRKGRD